MATIQGSAMPSSTTELPMCWWQTRTCIFRKLRNPLARVYGNHPDAGVVAASIQDETLGKGRGTQWLEAAWLCGRASLHGTGVQTDLQLFS